MSLNYNELYADEDGESPYDKRLDRREKELSTERKRRMKTFELQDIGRNNIVVQLSGAGDIRVYVTPEGKEDSICLHMTHNQATVLICAIKDLMDQE